MKHWKIKFDDAHSVPLWFAVGAISGVGTPELANWFLQTIQRELAASHCTIFALEENGRASVVSTASAYGDTAALTAQEYTRQGFDRRDSNLVWLRRKKTPLRSQAWMSHQAAHEVANAEYRRICYGEVGIRERASVLLLLSDGQRIAVSFYRNLALEPFQESELQWIGDGAPVLMAAVIAHIRQSIPASTGSALSERGMLELPYRERQVLSHVLAGHTMKEVAQLVGISLTTAQTYRYRAFAKLGVRTHRELLALLRNDR